MSLAVKEVDPHPTQIVDEKTLTTTLQAPPKTPRRWGRALLILLLILLVSGGVSAYRATIGKESTEDANLEAHVKSLRE